MDKDKQELMKKAWLGDIIAPGSDHPAAIVACARMRIRVWRGIVKMWIHPVTVKGKGEQNTVYVVAERQGRRDYYAPVPDIGQMSIANRMGSDGWKMTGTEVDFRAVEPISLQSRAQSGHPFVYATAEEAEEALAELIFEGAALRMALTREEDESFDESTREHAHMMHERVSDRSRRYDVITDQIE